MRRYFVSKNFESRIKEYIFIILTATIFLIISTIKSFPQENVFTVDNVKVVGKIDTNFSREKFISKAFKESFQILMSKILVSKDVLKLNNTELREIRTLISSFQVLEETYKKNEYEAIFKVKYNDNKIKKLLARKNISFSQPKNISVVFFPILFVNDNIKNFSENYFYNNWEAIEIKNELINYILPIEDLDDLSEIKKMKNNIEKLNITKLVIKYNITNYAFVLMNYNNQKLKVHIKTNLNDNNVSRNASYGLDNFNDEKKLEPILKELKMKISDIWKEQNLVNLLMPLSIQIKFQHENLVDLDKLKKSLYKINIIDNFTIQEFDINHSYLKIYYFGNPKKLKNDLLVYGYQLKNDQGYWELYKNE